MSIKQVSIFIENAAGRLAETTKFLADNRINLRALSIADSQDFGIVRIICENPEEAEQRLKEADFVTTITDVFAVELQDEAGSLSKVLFILAAAGVSVEYTYAFLSTKKEGSAYMIFRVNDNDAAIQALKDKGIAITSQKDIF
ncbi:MAG TPA: amino acid-binding protein [Lachnospiraceae bacterium]|nr:amino acid-binding protein [Lachnospiraceae bacterium]HPF28646.1 amino acid-binding protein [Lachnospiraceae bacterium]